MQQAEASSDDYRKMGLDDAELYSDEESTPAVTQRAPARGKRLAKGATPAAQGAARKPAKKPRK